VNLSTNRATAKLPPAQLRRLTGAIGNPASLKRLPASVHHVYILSFTHALDRVFVVAAVIAAAAFVLSWLLDQKPLRGTAEASAGLSETFAAPKPGDSLGELSRALSVLLGREGGKHLVEQIAARAGVDLSAAAAWLLVRVYREPATSIEELSETWDVPLDRARAGLTELIDRGMVSPKWAVFARYRRRYRGDIARKSARRTPRYRSRTRNRRQADRGASLRPSAACWTGGARAPQRGHHTAHADRGRDPPARARRGERMSRKWSSVVALGVAIAQVALLACGSSAAEASTASTAQQRTAFERAIARYARIESSTTQLRSARRCARPRPPSNRACRSSRTSTKRKRACHSPITGLRQL